MFQLAERYPSKVYRVVVVEPQTPWAFDPQVLSLKNSHGVSLDVIRKRTFAYELLKPTYYAWFLSKADSKKLMSESEAILRKCFEVSLIMIGLK